MQLVGKHRIKAARARVWQVLKDPATLETILPGISTLERVEDDVFRSVFGVKLGLMSTTFDCRLERYDMVEQESFRLNVLQNSRMGNAAANLAVQLASVSDDETEVSFDGHVKLSGMLATIGPRLIGGLSDRLTTQFFQNMERLLQELKDNA